MPIKHCTVDGKPGFKWGDSGHCYTYTVGDEASKTAAKSKAIKQAVAAGYQSKNPKDFIKKHLSAPPLAVCTVCGHEEFSFIDNTDPVLMPCPVCGGFMHDPYGYVPYKSTEDAYKLHYEPWKTATAVDKE
jgi:hypothetical protein